MNAFETYFYNMGRVYEHYPIEMRAGFDQLLQSKRKFFMEGAGKDLIALLKKNGYAISSPSDIDSVLCGFIHHPIMCQYLHLGVSAFVGLCQILNKDKNTDEELVKKLIEYAAEVEKIIKEISNGMMRHLGKGHE